MSNNDERLWGVPGGECMHLSAVEAYETEISPYVDSIDRAEPGATSKLEEWTAVPLRDRIIPADDILDNVQGWLLAEMGTADGEAIEMATTSLQAKEAAERLRSVIGAGLDYWCADRLVGEHTITWDSEGMPLLDGAPLKGSADV